MGHNDSALVVIDSETEEQRRTRMKNIIFLLSALVAPGQGSASEDGHETAEEREAATEQTTPGAAEVVPGPTEVLPGVELDVPGIEIQLPPAVSVQELELPEEKRKPVMPVAAGTEPGVFLEVPGIIVQAPELSEMTVKPQSRPLFVPKMVLYGPDEMKGKGKGFVILEKMEEEEEEEEEKVESPEESGKSEINGNSNNNFSEDLVIQALLLEEYKKQKMAASSVSGRMMGMEELPSTSDPDRVPGEKLGMEEPPSTSDPERVPGETMGMEESPSTSDRKRKSSSPFIECEAEVIVVQEEEEGEENGGEEMNLYSRRTCPLFRIEEQDCAWFGPARHMETHLIETHPHLLRSGPTFECQSLKTTVLIILFDSEIFLYYKRVSRDGHWFAFVQQFGATNNRYMYEIRLHTEDETVPDLRYIFCMTSVRFDIEELYIAERCLIASEAQLVPFITESGIGMTVTIRRRSQTQTERAALQVQQEPTAMFAKRMKF